MAKGEKYDWKEVMRLSQDEGYNDREISEILRCERATITRLRQRNGIPKCNRLNRKDKTYTCVKCGETIYIRRKDRRRLLCEDCSEEYKMNKNNIIEPTMQLEGLVY